MSADTTGLIDELRRALGDDAVLTGGDIGDRTRSDASQTGRHLPKAVLRPATVDAVATALRVCNAHRQSVVPQGGLTGLAGGASPQAGDFALSLERLTGIEEIDEAAQTMTVKAGTPLEVAQKAAEAAGFLLAIDLGARGSCQIGGNLSTNAGGIRVIRHGVTRDNVLGLEVALADGTVLTMLNKMVKNNTGYDLRQLFIGAEGTLGIITRAVLRLKPLPEGRATALLALASYDDVVRLLKRAQRELGGLSAFEAMWRSYFSVTAKAENIPLFAEEPDFAVIIETEGADQAAPLEAFLEGALTDGLINDALIAQSEKERRAFWIVREGLVMDRLPSIVNLDVSLAIGDLGRFAEACDAALKARFAEAYVSFYGHIGDSNMHIAVSVAGASEADLHEIDEIVYRIVAQYHGSISAEHGIGTLKRDYLGYSRKPEELDVMRRIKTALDPNGILNPGKVLPV
ncbi:FAD-binding oxidoreductase [Aestuariivirga sp. YIM B02566]|uniref:FAD-binding oxidoreductase n=1 Tax=Taklimakanibacter albus TaxID=2800327 RepID=A0ACC5R9B6_9HYPH|nr:FAD-binding oxidoreductase [Aestuariivirga sp. YIM B02566]MBK1869193.1 FAD-binding oxidoreductase [Aestuariivirga sp. YIM B02566]